MRLEFAILGPLRVTAPGGVALPVGGSRRRALLVRLLVTPGRAVSYSQLCEDVWDGHPPPGAASTLQSHISALRKLLGSGRVLHQPGGYLVIAASDEVDLLRGQELIRLGRSALADGRPRRAAALLGVALDCWQGTPLEDVADAAWVQSHLRHLEELRAAGTEAWLQARLLLGEHGGVAADAEQAITEHPFREQLWGQLMIALYRAGRQSDALAAYQRLRRLLDEELGLQPCAEVAALEHAILNQDPSLNRILPPDPQRRHPRSRELLLKERCAQVSCLRVHPSQPRHLPYARPIKTTAQRSMGTERTTPC
jgi:DNA-binding SARP family transcriptional activator